MRLLLIQYIFVDISCIQSYPNQAKKHFFVYTIIFILNSESRL